MNIPFWKMSGSGNDFIIIDNRQSVMSGIDLDSFIKKACVRSVSVGADGVILIEDSDNADFKWQFFNSDGSSAEMCGNGSRCAARFCYLNGIAGKSMSFETLAGIITAEIKDGINVKVRLTKPFDKKCSYGLETENGKVTLSSVNTGVPHAVIKVNDVGETELMKLGPAVRFHKNFSPAGTNVNVFSPFEQGITMRTYERGVEGETLACGTGAVACSIFAVEEGIADSPVAVRTASGLTLKVYIEDDEVYLEGEARIVYKGELTEEAYKY